MHKVTAHFAYLIFSVFYKVYLAKSSNEDIKLQRVFEQCMIEVHMGVVSKGKYRLYYLTSNWYIIKTCYNKLVEVA